MMVPTQKDNRTIDPELFEYTKNLIKRAKEDAKIQTQLREGAFKTTITI